MCGLLGPHCSRVSQASLIPLSVYHQADKGSVGKPPLGAGGPAGRLTFRLQRLHRTSHSTFGDQWRKRASRANPQVTDTYKPREGDYLRHVLKALPLPTSSQTWCVHAAASGCAARLMVQGLPLLASQAAHSKTYEKPGLSEEEIEEIREAFNLFDTDGSGA